VKSHGRSHDGHGRHRRASSPETRAWHEFLMAKDWLQPQSKPKRSSKTTTKPKPLEPAPAQPSWMDSGEYEALLELRARL
jgi:hypothetical protein